MRCFKTLHVGNHRETFGEGEREQAYVGLLLQYYINTVCVPGVVFWGAMWSRVAWLCEGSSHSSHSGYQPRNAAYTLIKCLSSRTDT